MWCLLLVPLGFKVSLDRSMSGSSTVIGNKFWRLILIFRFCDITSVDVTKLTWSYSLYNNCKLKVTKPYETKKETLWFFSLKLHNLCPSLVYLFYSLRLLLFIRKPKRFFLNQGFELIPWLREFTPYGMSISNMSKLGAIFLSHIYTCLYQICPYKEWDLHSPWSYREVHPISLSIRIFSWHDFYCLVKRYL